MSTGRRGIDLWPVFGLVLFLAAALGLKPQEQTKPSPTPPDKVFLPGVIRELASRLTAADRLIANQQWQAGIDEYLTILRDHGDSLVPVNPGADPLSCAQRFAQARWLVHQRIVKQGPTAWQGARSRLDAPARQWLSAAKAGSDQALLRRVIDDAFFSAPALQALELLGDYAFERADFAEAVHWWRLIAFPLSSSETLQSLEYPDAPDNVKARVRAKQIITLLFQEQANSVPEELKAYRRKHNSAAGALAGRSGNFADIVQSLLDRNYASLPAAEQTWPTFGGDPSRNRCLPFPLSPRLWAEGPAWRVRLDTGDPLPNSIATKLRADQAAPRPACYPAIVDGVAYIADHRFIRGFTLRTGKQVFVFDLYGGRKAPVDAGVQLSPRNEARFSVTVDDGHIFARLGAQSFGSPVFLPGAELESWLVCCQLSGSAAKDVPAGGKARWAVAAPRHDGASAFFEGSPLVHGHSVYIAQSRLLGFRTASSICCYDAATGQLRWQQEVCETPEFADDAPPRSLHHLLTLAGPYVVYASSSGAVVAVDADTGKRIWAIRYASQNAAMENRISPRDLCPPVAAGHRVVVAPVDSDRLFCLDALTGSSLWECEAVEVVHLLGIYRGRLIFTTPRGLCAVAADTGHDDGGWRVPANGSLPPAGRGLVADGWALFPTQAGKNSWRGIDGLSGESIRGAAFCDPATMRLLPPGNAAFGNGCLVIATADALWGFPPPQPPFAQSRN